MYLKKFIELIPGMYCKSTRLSRWNLTHSLLDEQDDRVNIQKEKLLMRDLYEIIISDGWTDPSRHHHILNALIHTINQTFWVKNIYTKSNSVNGEYQAEEFSKLIEERGGPTRVIGLCTDSASVMRKCWRLLMQKYEGFFAYGCIPHVLNLLFKDIFKLDLFAEVKKCTSRITTWFSRHNKDLAIFREVAVEKRGKEISLTNSSKTRFAIEVKSTKSCIDGKAELKGTVIDERWDNRKYSKKMKLKGQHISNIILDCQYWLKASFVVDLLEPLSKAIISLQSDFVSLGCGYHAFIEIHNHIATFEHDLLNENLRAELIDLVLKRLKFGITPMHVAAYFLNPRYARSCTISTRLATNILFKIMNNLSEDEKSAIRTAYGNFKESFSSPDWKDAWVDSEVYTRTAYSWWGIWGDDEEIMALQPWCFKLFSLVVGSSSAEGNWSDHGYLWTKRRNKTLPSTADKMLNIYSNAERVDGFRNASHEKHLLNLRSMRHCVQHESFKHIDFGTVDETEFDGMHEDEMHEEEDSGEEVEGEMNNDGGEEEKEGEKSASEDEDEIEGDYYHEQYVGDILTCPANVPRDLVEGSLVAVWFDSEGIKGWYEGTLTQVHKGKKRVNNCTATFSDGIANYCAMSENYGRKGLWVLLPGQTSMEVEVVEKK